MTPNPISHVRAAAARPFHRTKPDGRTTLSEHNSSTGAAARPALIILGTRGVPAAHGGFETFAEKLALHMVDRGWRVTVYCQRNVAAHSPLAGKTDIDQWRGIRRVLISVVGAGPRSTMVFDWRCVLHYRRHPSRDRRAPVRRSPIRYPARSSGGRKVTPTSRFRTADWLR